MDAHLYKPIDRRRLLAILGGAGAQVFLAGANNTVESAEAASCAAATPAVTQGPYWIDEKLFRSDIRTDPATGVARQGVLLALTITVQNESGTTCTPLAGAYVDIWHCDAIGIYSDEPAYNPGGGDGTVVTTGQKFLRGYQISDDNGQVQFTTIYPGWYAGRTIHIHVRVQTYSGSTVLGEFVTQLFFDDTVTNTILTQAPYNTRTSARDTANANDNVYTTAANPGRMLVTLAQTSTGYAAAITLGVTLATASGAAPAIASGGVASAATGASGLAPGSWTAIYGTNLAAATRTLTSSDLVNGYLPTSLGGVSVQVNNQAAYMLYISPAQINVLAPDDSRTGSAPVTVTNSAGTSNTISALMQTVLPGLFVSSGNYVRAVRVSDGAIIDGAATATAGDVLELYGTGFGPTATSVAAGLVFQGAYPTGNQVGITIGGVSAPVSFAGLVAAGLYQINVTVPAGVADGDHAVVATVAGVSSPSTALLKMANS
jgi:uncharacterized protein (TIGR03437 family)